MSDIEITQQEDSILIQAITDKGIAFLQGNKESVHHIKALKSIVALAESNKITVQVK